MKYFEFNLLTHQKLNSTEIQINNQKEEIQIDSNVTISIFEDIFKKFNSINKYDSFLAKNKEIFFQFFQVISKFYFIIL